MPHFLNVTLTFHSSVHSRMSTKLRMARDSSTMLVQAVWLVCRVFSFQCFNHVDSRGAGTTQLSKASRCVGATAFLVTDHLAQLLITDALPREGVLPNNSDLPAAHAVDQQ